MGLNITEAKCRTAMRDVGWNPTKRGWPDFIGFKDGRMIAVEVKPTINHPLKKEQYDLMCILESYGIDCYRYDPHTGFTELDKDRYTKGDIVEAEYL